MVWVIIILIILIGARSAWRQDTQRRGRFDLESFGEYSVCGTCCLDVNVVIQGTLPFGPENEADRQTHAMLSSK